MRRHSLRRGVVVAAALIVTGTALAAVLRPGRARAVSSIWSARATLSADENQLTVRTADGRLVATVDTTKLKLL
jgi:hypothetical protein